MAITIPPDHSATRTSPVVAPVSAFSPTHLTAWLLGAILALALVLRLWGLNWGLPWAFHPDENFYVDQAQDMLKFGDPNPRYFRNPSLLTYLIAAELLVVERLGPLAGPLAPGAPGSPYLLARLDSALIGTGTVAVVFGLGATLFGRGAGLLAALLLAVSFLHVRDSHYGVNDVPATGLLLLSVYCAARLLRSPLESRQRWCVLAGLFGGLATSTKYNMGFFFVPLLVAHWLPHRAGERGPVHSFRPLARSPALTLALAAAAALVGYLLGTPYTVLDFGRFSQDFQMQYRFGNQRWLGQPLEPVPLLYLTSLLQGFGALPLGLALVGVVLGWRQRRAETALLLAFPLVYLAFLLPKTLFFPRFALPLLPFCALFAAYAASELARRFGFKSPAHPEGVGHQGKVGEESRSKGRGSSLTLRMTGALEGASSSRLRMARPRLVAGLLLGAVIAQPLWNDLLHNRLLLQADTRILANEWVQANLPPGSRLKVEDYSLRDLSTQSRTYTPNTAGLRIERFEGSPEADQARYFAERNVQYVVTSSYAFERYLLDPPMPQQQESGARYRRLHRSLEQRAELVARFSPGIGGRELPYALDNTLTPFWSLEQYERPGPTIHVYSLATLAMGRDAS